MNELLWNKQFLIAHANQEVNGMKLMQPIYAETLPDDSDWCYEIKYDGFRAILFWSEKQITLTSRNGTDLTKQFPEIIAWCEQKRDLIAVDLPLQLDGELVILNTDIQTNFSLLQQRGRLHVADSINQRAMLRPAYYLCFDFLCVAGKSLHELPYLERKNKLAALMKKLDFNATRWIKWQERLGYIDSYHDAHKLYDLVRAGFGEGIIAKRRDSLYQVGKQHHDWFKVKNWRTITGIITSYDGSNGYFSLAVYKKNQLMEIGKWKHGLTGEPLATMVQFIKDNGQKNGDRLDISPTVCVAINCLSVDNNDIREPRFQAFRFDLDPTTCTYEKMQHDLAMFPDTVTITNEEKVFWPAQKVTKEELLRYLRIISPYMLPFLSGRALTIIRCPDGIEGESFFQKNVPDYAPTSVAGQDGKMLCETVEGLIWLANHGAIEYHIPFQYVSTAVPNEIVFDLDPASHADFSKAVFAAQLLKTMFDQLKLVSFVKTSGSKGLQVHIPITIGALTYEETGKFTQMIAFLLEKKHPDLFTTERLKKNRKGRLYIDYVQHGQNKTLIAPYSPRKTANANVACPLFWDELTANISPDLFTIDNVVERVLKKGCPFRPYDEVRDGQPITQIKQLIVDYL